MIKHVEVHISSSLTEKDWKFLRGFCEKARRLAATKLVSGKESAIRGKIRYEQEQGLCFESKLPQEEQISEFLMAFRFFFLQKEPTHFPKVLNLIGKHTNNPDARKAFKMFRTQWDNYLFGKALEIKFNDKPVTSSLLIDLWFNAHYFHSDEKKEQELNSLKEMFSEGFAKYMLLDAAYQATKVVFKLHDGLKGIVDEHYKKA